MATTLDEELLLDLPIEQLCGQISAVAGRVLDDPNGNEILLLGLAGRTGVDPAW